MATEQTASAQIKKLQREKEACEKDIASWSMRIAVIDAQIDALAKLAAKEAAQKPEG